MHLEGKKQQQKPKLQQQLVSWKSAKKNLPQRAERVLINSSDAVEPHHRLSTVSNPRPLEMRWHCDLLAIMPAVIDTAVYLLPMRFTFQFKFKAVQRSLWFEE